MAPKIIGAMHDTSFFDGVSSLLVTTEPRKTSSRINESSQSHTKNQTRKAIKVDGSTSTGAMHDTSFFDGVSCLLVTASSRKTNSRRVAEYSQFSKSLSL